MPPRACCREGRLLGGKKQKTWQPEEDVKKTKTAGAEGRWSFDGLLESLSAPMMTTCTAPGTKTETNWWQSIMNGELPGWDSSEVRGERHGQLAGRASWRVACGARGVCLARGFQALVLLVASSGRWQSAQSVRVCVCRKRIVTTKATTMMKLST